MVRKIRAMADPQVKDKALAYDAVVALLHEQCWQYAFITCFCSVEAPLKSAIVTALRNNIDDEGYLSNTKQQRRMLNHWQVISASKLCHVTDQ
jgi:hypothetical protein